MRFKEFIIIYQLSQELKVRMTCRISALHIGHLCYWVIDWSTDSWAQCLHMTLWAQFRKTVSISLLKQILQTFWLFSSSIFNIWVSSLTCCCSLLIFFCMVIFWVAFVIYSFDSFAPLEPPRIWDWSEESAEDWALLNCPAFTFISETLD